MAVALFAAVNASCCAQASEEGRQQVADLGRCPLASGEVILHCRVGYRTFGQLDSARSNVVVMPTWLNGRTEDLQPLFGVATSPSVLVDTGRFFGVAFDAFGDGVSSSPSNSPDQPGVRFPVFTMEDMARAQYRVLTKVLHVQHVHAVVGLSMGGHQVFAWAVDFPHFVGRAVSIVGSPQPTNFDRLSKQIVEDAIESDPAYRAGHYASEPPLRLANAIGFQMVSAPAFRNAEAPRSGYDGWLAKIEAPQRQDANDRVWQLKAILHHDVLHGRPLADVARATLPMRWLVIAGAEDRMVTAAPSLAWAQAVSGETYVSEGACAHLILSCDGAAVQTRVQRFLAAP